MKKVIILTISFILSTVCLFGQQTVYVIDNVTVDHFDGSQLKGKTITDYQISTTGKGNKAVTVHAISTAPSIKAVYGIPRGEFKEFSFPEDLGKGLRFNADSLSLSGISVFLRGTSDEKVLYIIDGEKSEDASVLRSLAPDRIRSISVLKGRESQERFGTSQPVIVVETKTSRKGMEELLKKIPGVQVGKDGSVTVNGEPISKITINGRTYRL